MKLNKPMALKWMSLLMLLLAGQLSFVQQSYGQELQEMLKDAPPQKLMAVGLGLMDLNDANKAEFGKVVDEFSVKTGKAIRNILKRNGSDKPRQIGKKLKRSFKNLDKRMKSIVPENKWDAYLIFKKGLADQLTPG